MNKIKHINNIGVLNNNNPHQPMPTGRQVSLRQGESKNANLLSTKNQIKLSSPLPRGNKRGGFSTKNYKPKTKNHFGFTLVELIVVIVILAILATISFLSFNSYSSSARDSTRMSNISMISKGIDMNIALGRGINTQEAGTGMNILIVGSGGISYTGYYMNIGNKLLSSIQLSGGDILSDSFQKYQLTYIPDKKYYQVLGLLENQLGSSYIENNFNESENNNINKKKTNISINNLSIIPKVYSSTTSSGFAFIKGNFPVNTASGGYIKGLIPKDYTNAPVVNGISVVSGTGDILLPAEIISSNGGYTDTITEGGGETVALNCSGTTQSGYTITALNDSQSQTFYKSISYGTGSMSATCTNGNLSYGTENISCTSGYTVSGDSCIEINIFPGEDGIYGTADDCNTQNITLTGGQVWSACNLGANTAFTPASPNSGTFSGSASSIRGGDDNVNGLLYQWGRNKGFSSSDASQLSTQLASNPNGADTYNFVWNGTLTNYDWLNPQINTIWGGSTSDSATVDGQTNDVLRQGPCPAGWHVPSAKDWQDACNSITSTTCTNAMANTTVRTTLLLPYAGYRNRVNGLYYSQGSYGYYWSSSPSTTNAFSLDFPSAIVRPTNATYRANGLTVRCLKN